MEPGGSPIGRHVAAVTPGRAYLHSTQRLPHGLAVANAPLGSDHLAITGDDALWDGRHFLVDAATNPAQDCEAESHDNCQYNPESLHVRLLTVSRRCALSPLVSIRTSTCSVRNRQTSRSLCCQAMASCRSRQRSPKWTDPKRHRENNGSHGKRRI